MGSAHQPNGGIGPSLLFVTRLAKVGKPPGSEAPDPAGKVGCGGVRGRSRAERQRRVSDRSADLCWSIRGDGLAPIPDLSALTRKGKLRPLQTFRAGVSEFSDTARAERASRI